MKKNSGFTLIEMMIAIAIIAILSAITVPNYITHRNNQKVTRAARSVYSALQAAKMHAIQNNTPINVIFTTGSGSAGTFQVFEDVNDSNTFDAGDDDILTGQMPSGVTLLSANFAAAVGASSTRFTRLGLTTGANGTVVVDNGNADIRTRVRVNTVGGIRVELDR